MSNITNQYLSIRSGLAERQLNQAERCNDCRGALQNLVILGEAIEQSYSPDERIQSIAAFTASQAIRFINQHHPYVSDFLASQSGLTHRQLADAKGCEQCKGCFKRLFGREKEVVQSPAHEQAARIETLRTSRAIGLINQHHPFDMKLLEKHTCLKASHIISIENCPNADCNCKKVWAELKDLLEKYEDGALDSVVTRQKFL